MIAPLGNKDGASKRTHDLIRKLEEKKYEDNHLKELERRRFLEAKQRLKMFIISRDPNKELDSDQELEQTRLLNYYKHRFCTFIAVMKEGLTARRVKGPMMKTTK